MDKKEEIKISQEVIDAFHLMWDMYPGSVRLIHKSHVVLACNPIAQELAPEGIVRCIDQGTPESHKGCKSRLMLKTQIGQFDRPSPDKIRAWIPVKGYEDIYLHFGVIIPE